jgi:inosose dehydratase
MAAAPISWGICEVPGWGLQLPVDRVLGEMRDLGLHRTELGAAGWLPDTAPSINAKLSEYGLGAVAAFVPLALHDAARYDAGLASARHSAELLQAVGAQCFVACYVSDPDDWFRPEMTDAEWDQLCAGIAAVDAIAAEHGLVQVVHPHVNSLVELASEIDIVIERTEAKVCLDTGHMVIGGADPVAFAREHADRVGLVHLKDVRLSVAARERAGELTLMEAVQAGMFTRLGAGDVDLAGVVRQLEDAGYEGWYVFEQDAALTDGLPPEGQGPIDDVRASVQFLRDLAAGA